MAQIQSLIRELRPHKLCSMAWINKYNLFKIKNKQFIEAEVKVTHSECRPPHKWGTCHKVFWSPFYPIFSPLNGWEYLWLGVEYSLRGGLKYGLDCPRLHHLWVSCIYFLKTLYKCSKNCSPLLVKHHRGRSNRVISSLNIFTVHVPWFLWSEFLVQMLEVSVLDAISSCSYLIKCKIKRCIGCLWAQACLSCLILNPVCISK